MRTMAEKEHPKGPLGTVKKHKTTRKQQALFGIARGMQKGETPKGYSPAAAKIAGGLSGKEVHKIASKPKSGYRRSPKNSESAALARVLKMVAEVEAQTRNRLGEDTEYGAPASGPLPLANAPAAAPVSDPNEAWSNHLGVTGAGPGPVSVSSGASGPEGDYYQGPTNAPASTSPNRFVTPND